MRTKTKALSPKQRDIINFTQNFVGERGFPPTIRDIKNGCGISSTSVVNYNLNVLVEHGLIKRTRDVSRGIELTGQAAFPAASSVLLSVPLLGTIAAGVPIDVPETSALWLCDEFINIPAEMVGSRTNVYALTVRGTSMIEAFINDGDTVVLEATNFVENGQVAACWLIDEQEITLKKYYNDGVKTRLVAQNPQFPPIITKTSNVQIQGRLLAVLRSVN